MYNGMITRREFLKAAGGGAALGLVGCASVGRARKSADIRVEGVSFSFEDFVYRAPVGFAGAVMDRATLITVRCEARTREGKVGSGFGTIPFNHIFSFRSKRLSDGQKNEAMKALAGEIAQVTRGYGEFGHPIEMSWELAPLYLRAAKNV